MLKDILTLKKENAHLMNANGVAKDRAPGGVLEMHAGLPGSPCHQSQTAAVVAEVFHAGGATVLDEEVAGLQLDVEWTEGVEERVRELLERSTLKRGEFDGVHDTVEVPTSMCVRGRWRKA